MVIRNKDTRVIVLKAKDMPKLRLFPGYNNIDKDNYKNYFENNEAAQAHLRENLSIVPSKDLTADEKAQNKAISAERVGVEHSIGGVKIYHIVRDIYRNHRTAFEDLVMETACGLFNLRLDCAVAT